MLPNLKFLTGGILFCLLLFVAAGTGVMLPDSRTRVGETPEIGHPMMQQSLAEVPPPAQFYVMTLTGRNEEPASEHAADEIAATPAQLEPGPSKPDLSTSDVSVAASPKDGTPKEETPAPDTSTPNVVANGRAGGRPALYAAPGGQPEVTEPASADAPAQPRSTEEQAEAAPPQVAALTPSAAEGETVAAFVKVPLPPARPTVFGLLRHGRWFHRRHRIVRQRDTADPGIAVGQNVPAGQAAPAGPGAPAGHNFYDSPDVR